MSAVTEAPEAEQAPRQQLAGEALNQALKFQLEFYFSPQNLSRDQFLRSKMDEQGFVPVQVLTNFNRIKELAPDADAKLLTTIIRQVKHLALNADCTAVKANAKVQRTTLILREIPRAVPEEEVKEIFNFPECGTIVSLKAEVGDTWYVRFETEEACENASLALLDRTFRGNPVRCRIKSETQARSFYSAAPVYWQPQQYVPMPYKPNGAFPNSGYQQYGANGYYGRGQYMYQQQQQQQFKKGGRAQQQTDGQTNGRHGGKGRKQGKGGEKARGKRRDRSKGRKKTEEKAPAPEPSFDAQNFPALPGAQPDRKPKVRYTKEEMSAIVTDFIQHAAPLSRPRSFPASAAAFTRKQPLDCTQLDEPFPIIYPASPSPELAAQSIRSSEIVPFFDLDMMPTMDAPHAVSQEEVSIAVAHSQGIEVPKAATDSSRRQRAGSRASQSQVARSKGGIFGSSSSSGASSGPRARGGEAKVSNNKQAVPQKHTRRKAKPAPQKDADDFTTVTYPRKNKGGHGGHGGHGHGRGGGGGRRRSSPQQNRERKPRQPRQPRQQQQQHNKPVARSLAKEQSKAPAPAASSGIPGRISFADMLKRKNRTPAPAPAANGTSNGNGATTTTTTAAAPPASSSS